MPIKPFSFPLPETRFFHTTKYVYKFKIRYSAHFCSEDTENKYVMSELLDSIRAILGSHDNLQPFLTKHFIIFPYKSEWESASRLKFKHCQSFLQPFPYVFTIYVEPYALVYGTSEKATLKLQVPQWDPDPERGTNEPRCPRLLNWRV
ncbi:membrane-anchored junction protein [Bufo gargarizans]|uniref:membrane-anchored junction protein n=1 Tax=Bufo gargarizans TaxID=30331 RepID=UPI001CF422FE|nr:membrane-anchored junction protein [Bufo gargarizans]